MPSFMKSLKQLFTATKESVGIVKFMCSAAMNETNREERKKIGREEEIVEMIPWESTEFTKDKTGEE